MISQNKTHRSTSWDRSGLSRFTHENQRKLRKFKCCSVPVKSERNRLLKEMITCFNLKTTGLLNAEETSMIESYQIRNHFGPMRKLIKTVLLKFKKLHSLFIENLFINLKEKASMFQIIQSSFIPYQILKNHSTDLNKLKSKKEVKILVGKWQLEEKTIEFNRLLKLKRCRICSLPIPVWLIFSHSTTCHKLTIGKEELLKINEELFKLCDWMDKNTPKIDYKKIISNSKDALKLQNSMKKRGEKFIDRIRKSPANSFVMSKEVGGFNAHINLNHPMINSQNRYQQNQLSLSDNSGIVPNSNLPEFLKKTEEKNIIITESVFKNKNMLNAYLQNSISVGGDRLPQKNENYLIGFQDTHRQWITKPKNDNSQIIKKNPATETKNQEKEEDLLGDMYFENDSEESLGDVFNFNKETKKFNWKDFTETKNTKKNGDDLGIINEEEEIQTVVNSKQSEKYRNSKMMIKMQKIKTFESTKMIIVLKSRDLSEKNNNFNLQTPIEPTLPKLVDQTKPINLLYAFNNSNPRIAIPTFGNENLNNQNCQLNENGLSKTPTLKNEILLQNKIHRNFQMNQLQKIENSNVKTNAKDPENNEKKLCTLDSMIESSNFKSLTNTTFANIKNQQSVDVNLFQSQTRFKSFKNRDSINNYRRNVLKESKDEKVQLEGEKLEQSNIFLVSDREPIRFTDDPLDKLNKTNSIYVENEKRPTGGTDFEETLTDAKKQMTSLINDKYTDCLFSKVTDQSFSSEKYDNINKIFENKASIATEEISLNSAKHLDEQVITNLSFNNCKNQQINNNLPNFEIHKSGQSENREKKALKSTDENQEIDQNFGNNKNRTKDLSVDIKKKFDKNLLDFDNKSKKHISLDMMVSDLNALDLNEKNKDKIAEESQKLEKKESLNSQNSKVEHRKKIWNNTHSFSTDYMKPNKERDHESFHLYSLNKFAQSYKKTLLGNPYMTNYESDKDFMSHLENYMDKFKSIQIQDCVKSFQNYMNERINWLEKNSKNQATINEIGKEFRKKILNREKISLSLSNVGFLEKKTLNRNKQAFLEKKLGRTTDLKFVDSFGKCHSIEDSFQLSANLFLVKDTIGNDRRLSFPMSTLHDEMLEKQNKKNKEEGSKDSISSSEQKEKSSHDDCASIEELNKQGLEEKKDPFADFELKKTKDSHKKEAQALPDSRKKLINEKQKKLLRIKRQNSDSNIIINAEREKIYREKTRSISLEDFVFLKEIGKGAYGKVYLVSQKATQEIFAMKIIKFADKVTLDFIEGLQNEVKVLKIIEGEFLAQAYFSFVEAQCLCIVMEYLVGGDFRGLLEEKGILEEPVAKWYIAQLVLGVAELHSKNIIHRDLKPENLLIDGKLKLRLADFGLSEVRKKLDMSAHKIDDLNAITTKIKTKSSSSRRIVGTIDYIAPEVLFGDPQKNETTKNESTNLIQVFVENQNESHNDEFKSGANRIDSYSSKLMNISENEGNSIKNSNCFSKNRQTEELAMAIDWWGVGCLLYEFLTGASAFGAMTKNEVIENIKNFNIIWPEIGYGEDMVTPEAQDLILKFLDKNPKTRLGTQSIEEIKNHPFFRGLDWTTLSTGKAPISIDLKEVSLKNKIKMSMIMPRRSSDSKTYLIEKEDLKISRNDLLYEKNINTIKIFR